MYIFRESTTSDLSDQERAVIAVEKLIEYVKRDDKRNVRRLLTRYGYVLGAEYSVTPGQSFLFDWIIGKSREPLFWTSCDSPHGF